MKRVLCFGDSNTHGTVALSDLADRRRFDAETRWPEVMAAALGPGFRVVDEGHPGRTTVLDDPIEGAHKNGFRILPALLESHRPLDLVIVMLGTNDLKHRFSLTAWDIAAGIRRLGEAIRSSGCGPGDTAPRLLLIAPAPIQEAGILAEMFLGGGAKSRALARYIAQVAGDLGAGFFDAGLVAEVDLVDGIHLGADAHRVLGAAMAPVVRAIWEEHG